MQFEPFIILIVIIYCWVKVLDHSKRIDALEHLYSKRIDSSEKTAEQPEPEHEQASTQSQQWKPKAQTTLESQTYQYPTAFAEKTDSELPEKAAISPTITATQTPPKSFDDKSERSEHQKSPEPIPTEEPNVAWIWIKENWTGFLGIAAVVLGIAFGAVYVGFFASPFFRFLMITTLGTLFIGTSFWLRRYALWHELSAWLQAGGGAIILLAFLGGGYFEGLRFYDSANVGFMLMAIGLSINVSLAYYKPQQTLSASHVVLSLLALIVAPPLVPILWAAGIICVFGVVLSHRNQWNLNLIAALTAFSIITTQWQSYNPIQLYSHGIAVTLLVFIPSLLTHYRKIYQGSDVPTASVAHILAWLFCGYNLLLFQQGYTWVALPIGLGGIIALGMGLYAKRRDITWLFTIDFLIGEILLAAALFSLEKFQISSHLIAWFIALETSLFLILSLKQKWDNIIPINIVLSALSLAGFTILLITNHLPHAQMMQFIVSLIAALYLGHCFVLQNKQKGKPDDIKTNAQRNGLTYLSFANFVLGSFILWLFPYLTPPTFCFWLTAFIVGAMLQNKFILRDDFHKKLLLAYVVQCVVISWMFVFQLLTTVDATPTTILWTYFYTAIAPMGLLLITAQFGKTLYLEKEDFWLVDYALYLLGGHLAGALIWLTHPINAFLPTLLMLAATLICLESKRCLSKSESVRFKLFAVAFNNMGIWALALFLGGFCLDVIHSQATLFSVLSIRPIIAILGATMGCLWMISKPAQRAHTRKLLSPTLGFDLSMILLIFLIVLELSTPFHPIGYCLLGIVLMRLSKATDIFPNRKYLYSIGLHFATLIQVPIVSSQWASPLSNWYERSHVTGLVAIALSCYLAMLLSQSNYMKKEDNGKNLSFLRKLFLLETPLMTYLPIFLSLAAFLYWRFDGAILTALWVGEVFVMVLLAIYLKYQPLINIAYAFLIACLVRLIIYDFAQSDFLMRSIVFIIVGVLLVGIHVMHKKLKMRLQ